MTQVKQRLTEGGYTCVLRVGDREYCSTERGVKPLLAWLDTGESFRDAVAADKVIGAGAAWLYVLLGVRAVWAAVISENAVRILEEHGIAVTYDTPVPYIRNRAGDGGCPIEACVEGITEPAAALAAIRARLTKLIPQNR